jgi:hypothetical protein
MELSSLLNLNLAQFEEAADDWQAVSRALSRAADALDEYVAAPLESARYWQGEDATEAAKSSRGIHKDILAVSKEAGGVQKYLDAMATGDGDGYGNGNLKQAQDKARELVQETIDHGLLVDDDGTVRWEVVRAPGPLSPEQRQEEKDKQAQCDRLAGEFRKVLKTSQALDEQLKEALLLIFGTEDTFRTEDRGRRDGDADMGDRMTEAQLTAVSAYMKSKGRDDAASLMNHFLEGSGKPYEVDANRMLAELPTFQKDVRTSLTELKKQPDGPITTDWQSTSSGTKGNDKVMNWYYALHHFEYRVVGHKTGGHITYQVEVQKDYDWGTPSEHRKDLTAPGGLVDAEQSEVARLNHVRLAQDFQVHGRTSTQTTG